ncbi:phosphate ABC transporter substrate-binding protein [Oleispira antarctica]|uniref:Phosphate ABC transporter substrate-binding protein n=1 Tax=Oleispira antarctica TaxID=188908 RepID=A0A1Y5HS59_OLEAN|nr:phosphate ABC transporter substrate-binding protein [Oleispira antarctica]
MNTFYKSIFFLLLSCSSMLSFAEVAVIISSANSNASIASGDITKIFLGKSKKFPDGSQAVPIDQDDGTPARDAFNEKVLGKSDSQLKSYWSRLIFTGKGTPPKQSGSDADVKALIAKNPNMIGYIDASAVDGSVKVVHKF